MLENILMVDGYDWLANRQTLHTSPMTMDQVFRVIVGEGSVRPHGPAKAPDNHEPPMES